MKLYQLNQIFENGTEEHIAPGGAHPRTLVVGYSRSADFTARFLSFLMEAYLFNLAR
jgi:hypothetical protein